MAESKQKIEKPQGPGTGLPLQNAPIPQFYLLFTIFYLLLSNQSILRSCSRSWRAYQAARSAMS